MTQQSSVEWLVENAEYFFGHHLDGTIIEQSEKMYSEEQVIISEIVKELGILNIGNVCKGKAEIAGGYKWKYKL